MIMASDTLPMRSPTWSRIDRPRCRRPAPSSPDPGDGPGAHSYAAPMAGEHFKDGKLSGEGAYKAGLLDGEWMWYPEGGGRLQQGAFVDGEQHGPWRRWHDNGSLLDEGTYDLGKKVGEWVTYGKDGEETKRKHLTGTATLAAQVRPAVRAPRHPAGPCLDNRIRLSRNLTSLCQLSQ